MYDYYCKNCCNLLGEWNNILKNYYSVDRCINTPSLKFHFIYFLNCKNCKKFVGIECSFVCIRCFGKNSIFGEENLKH